MAEPRREIMERKLSFLRQYLADLEPYGRLDAEGRAREHYAIEDSCNCCASLRRTSVCSS